MTERTLKTVEQAYEELAAPFAEEALSTDSSRGFDLCSVKAQYIIERLNDVCGVNGWRLEGEWTPQTDGGVLYLGRLSVFFDRFCDFSNAPGGTLNHYVEAVGFSDDKKNMGDSYKGARTDALSKSASSLGVANDVFKGNVKAPSKKAPAKAVAPSADTNGVAKDAKKPASFMNKNVSGAVTSNTTGF